MKRRIALAGIVAIVGLCTGADLLACGDKFLSVGRGTRYQRPKSFRAASILFYANPSDDLRAALKDLPVEAALKREGHRTTTVETPAQLSAILAGGHFDVILVGSGDAEAVEKLLGESADGPVMLSFCGKAGGKEPPAAGKSASCVKTPARERSLLEAIDKAVERHDQNSRKTQTRA